MDRLTMPPHELHAEWRPPRSRAGFGFAVAAVFLLTDIAPLKWLTFPRLGMSAVAMVSLTLYAISLYAVLRQLPRSLRTATGDVLLWLTILVAIASSTWSLSPETTARACLALLGSCLIGVYLASNYTLDEQLTIVWKALGVAAVASLLFALGFSQGVHSDELAPAWKGLCLHKNHLGRLMALSSLASCLVFLRGGSLRSTGRWLPAGTFCLSVYLLYRSQCIAAVVVLVSLLAPLASYVLLRAFWSHRRAFGMTACLMTTAGLLALLQRQPLLAFLGRDATLSKRTWIWQAVLPIVEERPWFGYGYKAFWSNTEGPYADLSRQFPWKLWHAHGGFLDLMLDVGLLGTIPFLVGYAVALMGSVRLLRNCRHQGLWPLALLSFLFLFSLVESHLFLTPNSYTVLYVAVVLSLRLRVPTAPPERRSSSSLWKPVHS